LNLLDSLPADFDIWVILILSGHEQRKLLHNHILDQPEENVCSIKNSISANVLASEVKRLMSLKEWKEDETKSMVPMMTRVASIDVHMSSQEGMAVFGEFKPCCDRYLLDNPVPA
jgi:hypothetical protein